MKNVYLAQPNVAKLNNSLYLPYSIGCIAAYSFQFEEIRNNYNLCDFIFVKSPIDEIVSEMDSPCVAGFSCYMWNIDYNLSLARAIKEKWPDCTIVFGGPQVPDDFQLLEENDYIDVLIHGEGEISFYELLKAICNKTEYNNIPSISYRNNNTFFRTKVVADESLENFPSPYSSGMFDYIINDPAFEGIQFDAVLETNRGCPYNKCVYCCWSQTEGRLRQFPIERVKNDLKWMAENHIAFCICADSNFGILKRDEELAEYIVELKKTYGYPQKLETIATKNKSDLTFRINSKLESAGLNRGISLAIQSFSPDVLKIVGRQNVPYEEFAKELERYRNSGIYTYTDLMLGLPGDTLESFCKSLFDVIEAGQHDAININKCELLPNTKMYEKAFIEKYKIKTIRSQFCQSHVTIEEKSVNSSRSELVVETSTMSTDDWRTALRISICVQSFHSLGLLKYFAIYLRKAKNLSYYDFYMNLYSWIENHSTFIRKTMNTVCESIDSFLKREGSLSFIDQRFGNIYWDFQEGLFLLCALDSDKFFDEIKAYLASYFDDEVLFNDIFNYQKSLIALPFDSDKEIETEFNWKEYFEKTFDGSFRHPQKEKCKFKVISPEFHSLEDYAREVVWYGKRLGRTINRTVLVDEL